MEYHLLFDNNGFFEERTTEGFQAHYANLNVSECITSILKFWRFWLKTSKYDSAICNVVQKSFFYEIKMQVKRSFDNAIQQNSIEFIFIN
jgi:hypothetical protein